MPDRPDQELADDQQEPVFHSAGFAPRRRGSRAPWIFAGVSVLVVATVVTLVLALTGRDDAPDGPTELANAVVGALNAQDEGAISTLMCQRRVPNVLKHMEEESATIEQHATFKGISTVTDDSATALVVLHTSYQGADDDLNFELYLDKQGTGWCAEQFAGPASYTRP